MILEIFFRFPLSLAVTEIKSSESGQQMANSKMFNFLILISNFNAVFWGQNDHLYVLLIIHRKILIFSFEKGSFSNPNSEILHIWKVYLTLQIVKQDKCPKHRVFGK